MTKQELLTKVASKIGFHSIIKDELAPDNVPGDPIEKRYLYINHTNADGTMGKTFVYYLHDVANDVASFYNLEAEALDNKEPASEQKKLDALQTYLKGKYQAYFVTRFDMINNWAIADVYSLSAGTLVKKTVMVFKKGVNPITDLDIV